MSSSSSPFATHVVRNKRWVYTVVLLYLSSEYSLLYVRTSLLLLLRHSFSSNSLDFSLFSLMQHQSLDLPLSFIDILVSVRSR